MTITHAAQALARPGFNRARTAAAARLLRARLRLASALVLLAFVLCHFFSHIFLIVSVPLADRVLSVLMAFWWTEAGTWLLAEGSERHIVVVFVDLRGSTALGKAIVGAMGPPRSQTVTAIGDTVNTAARLESLTKDYDCSLIVSRQTAAAAGLDLPEQTLHRASVKGRVETVEFFTLAGVPPLPEG